MSDEVRLLSSTGSSNDDSASNRSEGSPIDQKPIAGAWPLVGQQLMTLSPTAADQAALLGMSAGEPAQSSSTAADLSGDAEGVWSPDIDQAFQEALSIYPPCGRRKIILSDEGKMYGRNELIARYIKIRCGKTRTRKQVSSHIQVLARKKLRETQGKRDGGGFKSEAPMTPENTSQKDTSLQSLTQLAGIGKNSVAQQNGAALLQANGVLSAGIYPALWPQGFTPAAPTPINPQELKNFQQRLAQVNGGYENLPFLPLKTLVSSPSPQSILSRVIASSLLTLKGFTAYVDFKDKNRVNLVHIPEINDGPLEILQMECVADKFPPQLGELLAAGPVDAFFVVKCWANVAFEVDEGAQSVYAVDSYYTSRQRFDVSVSTKVCSFGKQVVEKVETYSPCAASEDGLYEFRMEGSPMCEYMVKFVAELKKLDNHKTMDNVLENFTVVTNKDTKETLMVIAFVFAVSTDDESTCTTYRLTV